MAFLEDVLDALCNAPLHRVAVVSNDERVRRLADTMGVRVLADPADTADPLNSAIRSGAMSLGGDVLAVVADLPCLTAQAVASVLASADTVSTSSFLGDAAGTGTTMLAMRAGAEPAFGVRSRARHAALGYRALTIPEPEGTRARRDVDSPVDLWDATRIGVGPATTRVLDWSLAP